MRMQVPVRSHHVFQVVNEHQVEKKQRSSQRALLTNSPSAPVISIRRSSLLNKH